MKKNKTMNSPTLQWLWRVTGKRKFYIFALTLIQAVQGGTGVLYALLLRLIVDSAVEKYHDVFWRNVAFIIGLVIVQLSLSAIIRWLNELAKCDMENLFKQKLTDQILRKDYSAVTAVHTGEWMNRLTNDTKIVSDGLVEILPGLTGTIVRLMSALVMIIALDPWFAYILFPCGVLLIGLTYAFRRVLKRLHKSIQESDGSLRVFLQERIGSLMIIKSFSREQQEGFEAQRKMEQHKTARLKRNRFSNLCNVGFAASMQGMFLIAVVYCANGIMTDRVTYGTLTAVMQLIGQVQGPFANISSYLPRWYALTGSAERLMEIEKIEDDCDVADLQTIQYYYENRFHSLGFRHASFSYIPLTNKERPFVLDNFDFTIQKGEYVAFSGHSGCGKSTVLKLLMCMYPLDSGERFIDEQLLTMYHRRLFAYVPQGNQLISGTIREIVSFADPASAYNEDRLIRALKVADAEEYVMSLERGVDTMLGERGTGLSEGQMQRLAIARAVFSDSPILLLDEATSALDEATEKKVLKNLQNMTDRTVVIVTHRQAALTICDRVLQFTEKGIEDKLNTEFGDWAGPKYERFRY